MSLIPTPLREGFERLLAPLVDRLVASRTSPNAITTVGTAITVLSGVAYGAGGVRLGAALLLLSGVCDMLDGRVARTAGTTTKFGAFYDSTLDRVGESALFGGIAMFFLRGGGGPGLMPWAVGVAIAALAAGLLVSYARARAEGLGLDCKVGIAQRAERILGLGAPTLFFGAGPRGLLLFGIAAVLAVIAAITVVQRVVHVRRVTEPGSGPRTTQARQYSEISGFTMKGNRSDR
jgi:CDP-diacylglycerol--glycerol-3-phosphate 3-phosphatidyltransferase